MKRLPEGSIPRRDGLKMLYNRNGWKVFHSSSQKKIRLIPLLSESGSRQPLSIQSMFRGGRECGLPLPSGEESVSGD